MGTIDEGMRRVVEEQRLGYAATVCPDATPNLSPKGTTAVWDDDYLIFADIRSPRTVENLRHNSAIEINVVDPISRKGYRFKDTGTVLTEGTLFDKALAFYRRRAVANEIRAVVLVEVGRALPLTSPAYDLGATEQEVRERWERHHEALGWDESGAPMGENIGGWIRTGVWALPVYGLLTFWATFTHEPNRHTEVEAYARYISTTNYLAQHLLGSILGVMLAVFGVIALGAYLASSRSGRLALLAMVLSVAGHCLVLTIFGFSTIISPVIGRLYLAGQPGTMEVNEAIFSSPAFIFLVVPGLLLYVVGTILFGVAIWRSGMLPKWAGVLYAPTGLLIAAGVQIGVAQTLGSALVMVAGGWNRLERDRPTCEPARSRSPAVGALTSAWLAHFREPDKAEVPRTP